MRYCTQTLLRNQLARLAVDAIGFVLNADQRSLQTLDELLLALSHLDDFLLALCLAALLKSLVGW